MESAFFGQRFCENREITPTMKRQGASEMVRIGLVGIGFMGWIHYLAIRKITNATLQAIATRDPQKQQGDWRSIKGNFGPPGEKVDLAGVAVHGSIESLCADPNVDLVDICLPSDQHAHAAEQALNAGKHVLVEKPIALTTADADRMISAASLSKRLLMVAHVLPYFPDFKWAWDAIRDGRFGKLKAAHFRRHISPPDWSDAFADAARTGGPAIDLHVHDTHFIRAIAGAPSAVHAVGITQDGRVDYLSANYIYPDGPAISATSGARSHSSRPFTHGYEIYLEHATLFYEAGGPLVLFDSQGRSEPTLKAADPVDAFVEELSDAVSAVETGTIPAPLDPTSAQDALALCHAGQRSVLEGSIIRL
jgi:predicted dehydrogenase